MQLLEMDSYIAAFIMILVTTVVSVAGLLSVRRSVSVDRLTSFHEVGGYLLSVIGTMYAVLLGLVVVDAMTRFETAQQCTVQEANALIDVYILSNQYTAVKKEIHELCRNYADVVVNEEWDAMDNITISQSARENALKLVAAVSGIDPQSNRDQALYQQAVSEACQLLDSRNSRIYTALVGIPMPEWIVLIAGGVATVVFTYFFGLENLKVQILMTAIVALLISLNLYLVLLFGYPFSGDVKVRPKAMQRAIELMEAHDHYVKPRAGAK